MRTARSVGELMFVVCLSLVLTRPEAVAAQTPFTPEQQKATADITEYFRRTTARLAHDALAGVRTLDDWRQLRPVLREQLLDMLGLWPMPERTDLHATVTGIVEHDGYVIEKLHYQSRPGLYVTANFYRPKQVDPGAQGLPTILYLCGHGNVKIDGVSYGSKASYHHHPVWFVREGYCCMTLDTLQLGEIEGLHHGTHREGMWWWLDRGYSPAGVEAWNAVRALDYLQTRPEVDMERIGVTGRSGGGAYTWWLAAIDDRPTCLVPVAGITDLENHVVDGCIEGHCDCMFMVNTYQWDFPILAALAAPRPLLLSNSDKDSIFPLSGVVRTHAKLRSIYELHGASNKLGLLITEGPHKDTQDLQVPAFRWMNRWLQDKDAPITRVADKPLDPRELKVFAEPPAGQRNTTAHEWFVAKGEPPEPPRSRAEWESLRMRWLAELRDKTFRGWPAAPPPLDVRHVMERVTDDLRLQVLEFTTDENLRLPVYVISGSRHPRISRLIVSVVDHAGWNEWVAHLASAFGDVFDVTPAAATNRAEYHELVHMLAQNDCAIATFPPRGVGPNQWNPDKKADTHIQRRFVLLGKTADDGRVWDVCRATRALRTNDAWKESRLWMQGRESAAGIALYAAMFIPDVDRIDLYRPYASHRDGPHFLNVLRTFDMPQAAAMVFPAQLVMHDSDATAWQWTAAVARLYDSGGGPLRFHETPAR